MSYLMVPLSSLLQTLSEAYLRRKAKWRWNEGRAQWNRLPATALQSIFCFTEDLHGTACQAADLPNLTKMVKHK